MKQFPQGGLIGKTVHMLRTISDLDVPVYAANAGFFILLSLFPGLVLLLGILRFTGLQVASFIDVLYSVLPVALMDTVENLIFSTYDKSSGALVGLSALTALWSASKGVYGFLTGLNTIYGVSEDRGYFYTRLISLFYTFLFFGVLILTLVIHVFGTTIVQMLPAMDHPILAGIMDLRVILLLGVQSLIFALIFTFLPNGRNRFRDTLPGALLASAGWLIFSWGFSVYVERFAGLQNIYGSVYSVALGMLWLYFCLCILFYGGALNQYLEDCRKK